MEPEGSFSRSQELTTCSYLESDQSSPHHPIPPFQDPSYYPPTYIFVFIEASFPLASLPIILTLSSSPYFCCMLYRSHPSWLNHSNYTWRRVQSRSSSLCSFPHPSVNLSLLGPNILLSALFSKTLRLCFSPGVREQFSHPYGTTGKIIILYITIFTFFDSRREVRRFWTEC
jgi:hypothetical protein